MCHVMEDESREAEVYRERELTEETRRKLVEKVEEDWMMNIICRFPSGLFLFGFILPCALVCFTLWSGFRLMYWFCTIVSVLVILGGYYFFLCRLMRPDVQTVWQPLELTSEYMKFPSNKYERLKQTKEIVVRWEDVKQINPMGSGQTIHGFELETKDMNLYKRFYPAFIVKEFQDVLLETRDEIKRRFPDKYWVTRWEKEEKEEEQQKDTDHHNI